MKLEELQEAVAKGAGWWTIDESGGKRVWTPHFGAPPRNALFPFLKSTNSPRKDGRVANFQGYELMDPDTDREGVQHLYQGLMDALKLRSETDVLSPGAHEELITKCAAAALGKADLSHNINPRRMFMIVPPSSSRVAKDFAGEIQRRLNIPDDQIFLDHFTKRDAVEIALDVMDNEKIHPGSKAVIQDRLENWGEGDEFSMKMLKKGHRNEMHNAGVQVFNASKEFNISAKFIPYLIIVDDNTQSGTTARAVAQTFVTATGKVPGKSIGLAMFKYP